MRACSSWHLWLSALRPVRSHPLARERLFELFLLIVFNRTGLFLKTRALLLVLLKLSSSYYHLLPHQHPLSATLFVYTSSHDHSLPLHPLSRQHGWLVCCLNLTVHYPRHLTCPAPYSRPRTEYCIMVLCELSVLLLAPDSSRGENARPPTCTPTPASTVVDVCSETHRSTMWLLPL